MPRQQWKKNIKVYKYKILYILTRCNKTNIVIGHKRTIVVIIQILIVNIIIIIITPHEY